ncbi:unnamed protein product [Cuscuta campestris]|uniref:Uncharacterized protein n=1 Tax=Cuscuta campestris TaxID=132261 RepID=A0A484M7T3_9ASTE|nr:unnamed protein product [Cuscuta campestris]
MASASIGPFQLLGTLQGPRQPQEVLALSVPPRDGASLQSPSKEQRWPQEVRSSFQGRSKVASRDLFLLPMSLKLTAPTVLVETQIGRKSLAFFGGAMLKGETFINIKRMYIYIIVGAWNH